MNAFLEELEYHVREQVASKLKAQHALLPDQQIDNLIDFELGKLAYQLLVLLKFMSEEKGQEKSMTPDEQLKDLEEEWALDRYPSLVERQAFRDGFHIGAAQKAEKCAKSIWSLLETSRAREKEKT